MESQKIINLLDSTDSQLQKFATKSATLLMIETLVVKILTVMVRIILQLNLKLKQLNLTCGIILMHTF